MTKEDIASFITTLIINDFTMVSFDRIAEGNAIINTLKFDRLGAIIKYTILLNTSNSNESLIDTLVSTAQSVQSTPIVISDTLQTSTCKIYSFVEFENLIGGFINTGLVLIPNLVAVLDELGHNRLPQGLIGNPDELLEIYVKECLQFLMLSPAKRFGSSRSFESLPDGIVLGKNQLIIQFDGKAYKNGFDFQADDIERFAKYVNDFNNRYGIYIGRIQYFLVVSGKFNDSEKAISNRSDELFKKCGAKFCCIAADELGSLVQMVIDNQQLRNAVDWRNIFIQTVQAKKALDTEMKRITKDALI